VNREDIIRMAREARFAEGMDWGHEIWEAKTGNLERFAALVAAAEREACAKVCEDEAAEFRSQKEGCRDARYDWKEDAAMECSLAIRKRGEVKP
jgi:hypothetical protein